MTHRSRVHAFSLLGLLVALGIVGLLVSVAVPNLTKSSPGGPKAPVERARAVDKDAVLSAIAAAKQRVLISEDPSVFGDDNEANFNVIKEYVTFSGASPRSLQDLNKSMGPGVTLIVGDATTDPVIVSEPEE